MRINRWRQKQLRSTPCRPNSPVSPALTEHLLCAWPSLRVRDLAVSQTNRIPTTQRGRWTRDLRLPCDDDDKGNIKTAGGQGGGSRKGFPRRHQRPEERKERTNGGTWGMNVSGRKYTLYKGPGWERSDLDLKQSAGWAGWRSKT